MYVRECVYVHVLKKTCLHVHKSRHECAWELDLSNE